ncbi:MAG: Lrp/AsnC family transcriptional regulator [Sneathiella sp.]
MDNQDRQILNIIQLEGRRPYAEIGNVVGLSITAVKDRLDKLLKRGSLKKFSAEVGIKAAGYDVLAFVSIGIDKPEDCNGFETHVLTIPQVQECHHVTGAFNYLVKILAKDMSDLETLLSTQIKIPGIVSRTETTIVFSSIKNSSFVDCLASERR